MSERSLSSKMANSIAKSASKSVAKAAAAAGAEESSMLDMVLMGAGIVIIILLLVYIYNRFIHKQPTKSEGFKCKHGTDIWGNCKKSEDFKQNHQVEDALLATARLANMNSRSKRH